MRVEDFIAPQMGQLISIRGSQGPLGEFEHFAFLPNPLPDHFGELSASTYRACSLATAKLSALNQALSALPESSIFRTQVINREAQATSAIEGTHTRLASVIEADRDEINSNKELREVINYVEMATYALSTSYAEEPFSLNFIRELHQLLFRGIGGIKRVGNWRDELVYLGAKSELIRSARFIPTPPGDQLLQRLEELVTWVNRNEHGELDPVIAAAATHYLFETLHPFEDGNGRIGRFLIVLQLMRCGALIEPIAISTWIEERRNEYTSLLYHVSTEAKWDQYISFIAAAIEDAASKSLMRITNLQKISAELRDLVNRSGMRGKTAHQLIEFSFRTPIFTIKDASAAIKIGYAGTNKTVTKLLALGILKPYGDAKYERKFYLPAILEELLRD